MFSDVHHVVLKKKEQKIKDFTKASTKIETKKKKLGRVKGKTTQILRILTNWEAKKIHEPERDITNALWKEFNGADPKAGKQAKQRNTKELGMVAPIEIGIINGTNLSEMYSLSQEHTSCKLEVEIAFN